MRRISLKYAGICVKCGRRIPEGETAYWEKGKGVWHLDCDKFTNRETQLVAAGTHGYSPTFGKQARPRTFGKWKLTPLRASHVRILLVLSIACLVAGLASVAYAIRMGPLVISQSTTRTNTVCLPQTMTTRTYATFLTTTGTVTYVSTFASTRVTTLGYAGPSCPYGGEYRSEICTSLCGCQHDVCVSFDYNCANDYPAVHSAHAVVVSTKVTTTGTSYIQQTQTQTLDMTRASTECGTATQTETTSIGVPNPSKYCFTQAIGSTRHYGCEVRLSSSRTMRPITTENYLNDDGSRWAG